MTDEPDAERRVREIKPGIYTAEYTEAERRELYSLSEGELEDFFDAHPDAQQHYEELQRLKRRSPAYWLRRAWRRIRALR